MSGAGFELFRQKTKGKEYGPWCMKFKGRRGYTQTVTLSSEERAEAEAEAARIHATFMGQVPAAAGPPAPAAAASQSAPAAGPGSAKLAAAWARPAPAPAAATPPAPGPEQPAAAEGELVDPKRQRRLARMLANTIWHLDHLLVGLAVRLLGRVPDEPAEDEEKVIKEAIEMELEERLANRTISPAFVIAVGSVGMGIGMWADGKPIERKPAPVLKLEHGGKPDQDQDQGK